MSVKLKLSSLFKPIDERLPKKTGIGGKVKPFRKLPLFDPSKTIRAKPALQARLAEFKTISPKQVREATSARLSAAVDRINRHIDSTTTLKGLRFDFDEASNRNVAVVRDVKTGQVLRQVPPEGVLQIARNLRTLVGILVNKRG